MSTKGKRVAVQNYVAKHAHKFNKAATFRDRKQALKRGHRKHKGVPFSFVLPKIIVGAFPIKT